MNIIKMFTPYGEMYVDAAELNCKGGSYPLRIYTKTGRRLSEVANTEAERIRASYGVHPDNLFASKEHALANQARIYKAIEDRQQKEGMNHAEQN